MSSGYTEFLNYTGPVPVDTTNTREGVKWNSYNPAGVVDKSLVNFTIPAFNFASNIPNNFPIGPLWLSTYIIGQFNCVAPQAFSLMDWNSVATQAALYNNMLGTLVISYRVGQTKYRYALHKGTVFDAGHSAVLYFGFAKLYNGQVIEPNFTIEAWTLVSAFPVQSQLNTPITLGTSILNQPQAFNPNSVVLPNIPQGTIINPTLYTALPSPVPMVFGNDGPWNDNP